MRRRDFISVLGGAAIAWPLAAHAQHGERVRRMGVLMYLSEDHPTGQRLFAGFRHRLQELGWTEGGNLHIDVRWAAGDDERYHAYAAELAALAPDIMVGNNTQTVLALQRASRSVPIVFVGVVDAVGSGLVASLPRPGGSATGFILYEYSIAAKWLELIKELTPAVTRVAVLRDATAAAGVGQFAAIQTVAPIGLELSVIDIREPGEIEHSIAAFARGANAALIVTPNRWATNHPDVIAALAARYKLPAVYAFGYFVHAGGLISYGPDEDDNYLHAASYVDRILKGTKPADLPVQAPVKYNLAINLKTAKALGLDIPMTVLTRADEVIE
jgi:putative ABC transport system substrate-binding protein